MVRSKVQQSMQSNRLAHIISRVVILMVCALLTFGGDLKRVYAEDRVSSLINYNDLTHTIQLTRLRAGNHSETGKNNYIFEAIIYALKIDKSEKKKSFEDRAKIQRSIGSFAENRIKTLTPLEVDLSKNQIEIDGDIIRELTSEAMRQFQVEEERVAIKVDIIMLLKKKKYYVLGENHIIGTTSYMPITEVFPHAADTKDQSLAITDKFGTDVQFKISYKSSIKQQSEGNQTGGPP